MDIRILELLCSRICHDLVSPIGAIHNGIELIEEMDGEAARGFMGEAVTLIAHSVGQADRRLRLFRLAYGSGGREVQGFADARSVAEGWLEGTRTRLDWPAGSPPDALAAREGTVKTLLNVIILADEALTHGGEIRVASPGGAAKGAEAGSLTVQALGRPGALRPDTAAALAGTTDPARLSPRAVHAWVTGRFAEAFGLRLTVASEGPEALALRLDW